VQVSPNPVESGLGELCFYQTRDCAHICLPLNLRFDDSHDLTHILHRRGTGFCDGRLDQARYFIIAELIRQEFSDDRDLQRLLVREIFSPGIFELLKGIFTLLGHLIKDNQDTFVIKLYTFIDLNPFKIGHDKTKRAKTRLVTSSHGHFYFSGDPLIDGFGHRRLVQPLHATRFTLYLLGMSLDSCSCFSLSD
jgi:hypothetical protein